MRYLKLSLMRNWLGIIRMEDSLFLINIQITPKSCNPKNPNVKKTLCSFAEFLGLQVRKNLTALRNKKCFWRDQECEHQWAFL